MRLGGTRGAGYGQFDFPWAIRFDAQNNNVIISDGYNHRLIVYDYPKLKNAVLVSSAGTQQGQLQNPRGISIQPHTNNIVVADMNSHRVQILNRYDGHVLTIGDGK